MLREHISLLDCGNGICISVKSQNASSLYISNCCCCYLFMAWKFDFKTFSSFICESGFLVLVPVFYSYVPWFRLLIFYEDWAVTVYLSFSWIVNVFCWLSTPLFSVQLYEVWIRLWVCEWLLSIVYVRVHSMLEKFQKMLEFNLRNWRPLKISEKSVNFRLQSLKIALGNLLSFNKFFTLWPKLCWKAIKSPSLTCLNDL